VRFLSLQTMTGECVDVRADEVVVRLYLGNDSGQEYEVMLIDDEAEQVRDALTKAIECRDAWIATATAALPPPVSSGLGSSAGVSE
jgi:hypothetical protein